MRWRDISKQTEMRDAAYLNARTVVLEAILQFALNGPVVFRLFHVNEVDDDKSGEVAQTQADV